MLADIPAGLRLTGSEEADEIGHVAAADQQSAASGRIANQLGDPPDGLRFDFRRRRCQDERPDIRVDGRCEKIAEDARAMRDSLDRQLQETDRIADASRTMLDIAQANDAIAREFNATVQSLVTSGREFESEVSKFKFTGET